MKRLFFIFVFLAASLSLVSGATLGGSPSSLEYDLDINEERCLIFVVSSEDYSGDLDSIMRWAEKDADVSSPDDFVLSNSEIDLKVDYSPKSINDFDGWEEVEVCILGYEEGTWKGSLEYRTESEGNVGVGVGTWLRVVIADKPDEPEKTEDQPSETTNSGGTSSGGGGGSPTQPESNNDTADQDNIEEISNSNPKNENNSEILGDLEEFGEKQNIFRITGNAVSNFGKTNAGRSIIALAFLTVIVVFARKKIYKKS